MRSTRAFKKIDKLMLKGLFKIPIPKSELKMFLININIILN